MHCQHEYFVMACIVLASSYRIRNRGLLLSAAAEDDAQKNLEKI